MRIITHWLEYKGEMTGELEDAPRSEAHDIERVRYLGGSSTNGGVGFYYKAMIMNYYPKMAR